MNVDELGNALTVSFVVTVAIVGAILAVIYAFIKKKRDYNSTGIPKRVEKPEEHEGSTNKTEKPEE